MIMVSSKLLPLSILFSTAARAVVAAKLVVSDVLCLISFILALRAVTVAKLVILGILFLALFILALRLVAKLVISGALSSISFYSTFTFAPKDFGFGKYSLIYTMSFLSIQMLKNYRSLSI